ncbi:arginine deiminase [Nocardioides marmotae]|uniref:Arginine deiminase n=1 Tax=Nocardioides marmotae TaxID=2663857 RepID=A0A6I3JDJ2_9ACTN|nr:arginine deiminase [Nocardioides marmotae]MCR6032541.1 arginine deiminase [Gordonia jinghuaiqii]MBC9734339.1 arginine deiminase [Nocardioides marmotae]MTB85439.1 arginine deiminase [Nocardioides marmotae]MTB96190.1 arginine deiminase [Nocardioides marmotae]QKD99737.1 arginine deiminase [Nocardioides marmotae]
MTAPESTPGPHGADSEVGRLRTVVLHRPGPELKRLTPRNNDKLLFDGIPWVARAQEEHDAFAEALRAREVEVLYLTELLTETLELESARHHAITAALSGLHLGDTMRAYLARFLREASPAELTEYLTAGIRNDEVRGGFGLVTSLLASDDFLVDPLPNLLFTRDSSVWVRDRVAVTSLSMPARKRETQLTELIYTEHPRFRGTGRIHGWHSEYVEGGDVLLLAPGVIAVGVGERTTPAGVERLARQVFQADLAHTVLAVPIAQERATMHLDTVCTMVDVDKIVMYPNVADSLRAHAVTLADPAGGVPASERAEAGELTLHVAEAEPFLVAAAKAMGIDTLHQIDTGLDPVTAEREQWDDGNNTLALAPRVAVAYERNVETNDRLEAAGIEVVRIAGSELGSGRGGPRCMSCPVTRDPLPA